MSTNRQRLDGKVAIVTGATGGIGEATAKLFLELGAKVMLVARSPDKLAETKARLEGLGEFDGAIADSTDEDATAAAVAKTVDRFGGLDILIANAGTEGVLKPIEALTVAEFNDTLQTNVIGVWLAMKYAVAPMKARGGGSIVALSSIAGQIGFPAMSPYVASKHAVFGLVKTAALELGPFNIRVNAVGPGPIDNRMIASLQNQLAPDDPAALREGIEAGIPMKRYGTSEEVAHLLAFLASDESSYCNGSIHMIDGGYIAA
ncbi:SDR family NAD(P)-dependent oxidoreductase [Sphingomonas sp.]|uniref:SDR family NAD(P)-dependent oxidoreductase n=1 Tax=Sphingomonas sp. TaxID=28214 RepID=UPI00286AAC33|nr:SDR family NAD(P)-dependent oxidoreductase [Sphingomonas sp.]